MDVCARFYLLYLFTADCFAVCNFMFLLTVLGNTAHLDYTIREPKVPQACVCVGRNLLGKKTRGEMTKPSRTFWGNGRSHSPRVTSYDMSFHPTSSEFAPALQTGVSLRSGARATGKCHAPEVERKNPETV